MGNDITIEEAAPAVVTVDGTIKMAIDAILTADAEWRLWAPEVRNAIKTLIESAEAMGVKREREECLKICRSFRQVTEILEGGNADKSAAAAVCAQIEDAVLSRSMAQPSDEGIAP